MAIPEKIDLTIIIISYNTLKITKNCLESVLKSLNNCRFNFEVIVIDNNSNDGSPLMIKKISSAHKQVRLLINKDNVGFAKANNQGVELSKSKYILFLNSDTIVINDAIITLMEYYRQHEQVVHFLGGKLLNSDNSNQPSCGPFYSLPVIFGALFLRGDYWGLTRYSPESVTKVDWISGACILTKKEYLQSINGFDENIFMYMDEIDLLYRAKKQGYHVYFYPNARFVHLGSASSMGRTQPIIQVFKGFTYFYKKHHNSPISIFLLRTMLKLKSWIALLVGRITSNHYLINTYEKALRLV